MGHQYRGDHSPSRACLPREHTTIYRSHLCCWRLHGRVRFTAHTSTDHIASCFSPEFLVEANPFPLPHDLRDSFAGAAWRYPERYLDEDFRNGTSAFRQLDAATTNTGLTQLRNDLETGHWDRKYSKVRTLTEYEHGYTFMLAKGF